MSFFSTLPGRLVLVATAIYLGAGGLSVLLPHAAGRNVLVFGMLFAIIATMFASCLAMEKRPGMAAIVVLVAPVQALLTFPGILVARQAFPAGGIPLVALACAALAAALLPGRARVTAPTMARTRVA